MKSAADTARSCPPSAVADAIVHWDDVREGDLAVIDGELLEVEVVEVTGDLVTLYAGRAAHDRDAADYTAVRRYTDG